MRWQEKKNKMPVVRKKQHTRTPVVRHSLPTARQFSSSFYPNFIKMYHDVLFYSRFLTLGVAKDPEKSAHVRVLLGAGRDSEKSAGCTVLLYS